MTMLSEAGNNIAQSILTAPISGILTGVTRGATYLGNTAKPNLIPDLRDMIDAWLKGLMTHAEFLDAAELQGYGEEKNLWDRVIQAKHPVPGIRDLIRMLYRGSFSDNGTENAGEFFKAAKRAGWWNRDLISLAQAVPWAWGPEEIRVISSVRGIDSDSYTQLLKSCGMTRSDDRAIFEQLIKVPSQGEIIELWNRGTITQQDADKWLKVMGYTDFQTRDGIKSLRFKIPSPSELIEFAVKEVWNDQVVHDLGYDDEFDQIPEFQAWMQAQGYGGSPDVAGISSAKLKNWAQAFWRAHWRNISPDQAFRMFQRFRPTGGPNGGIRNKDAGVFTLDNVKTILKINDYPPFYREKLAQLSYNVLRLVDIRRVVFLSLRSKKFKSEAIGDGFTIHNWAKENFLDRGQSPRDADILATLAVHEGELAKTRLHDRKTAFIRNRKFAVSQQEYKLGIADRGQTVLRFAEAGLDTADATELVNVLDREFAVSCAKLNLGVVKKAFMKGRMNIAAATERLVQGGFTKDGADRQVKCWHTAMGQDWVLEKTKEIIAEVNQGLISFNDAIDALKNLGWVDPISLVENAEIGQLAGE